MTFGKVKVVFVFKNNDMWFSSFEKLLQTVLTNVLQLRLTWLVRYFLMASWKCCWCTKVSFSFSNFLKPLFGQSTFNCKCIFSNDREKQCEDLHKHWHAIIFEDILPDSFGERRYGHEQDIFADRKFW